MPVFDANMSIEFICGITEIHNLFFAAYTRMHILFSPEQTKITSTIFISLLDTFCQHSPPSSY